ANATSSITLNPRLNRVWVKSETGVANITNTDLAHCDSNSPAECSNIPYTATTSALVLESTAKLIIETDKTFLPGGTVTLNVGAISSAVGGDVLISSGVTFNAEANAVSVGGDWTNSGTFSNSNNTVTFTATSTGFTITPSSSTFYDLTFNGSGGGWTIATAATTTNDFTITAGTVTSTSATLGVGGSWSNSGTFNHNSGTVLFNGSASETITDGSSPFYLLNFNGSGSWLYEDGDSVAPATTTVDNGTATFLNAKTGVVVVNGGTLNADWYLGAHVVDANNTTFDIANATCTIANSTTSDSTVWRNNGSIWGTASTSQSTVTNASGTIAQPDANGAIRIREYSQDSSTTTYYKYNLTIASLAGFGVYDYYADHGSKYLTSASSSESSGVDKNISISWHRATAGTMNGSQPYSGLNQPPDEGSWYAGMATDLEFSVDSSSVNLGTLNSINDFTATGTTILYATTSYSGGYTVRAYASNDGRLRLGATSEYIIRWDYANSTPATWSSTCNAGSECGFGYTTSDNSLSGGTLTRFNNSTNYAGFATSSPGDIIADSTSTASGAETTIEYKVSVQDVQANGDYTTTVYYICTANY
ncbi:MAG: hypothetical protein ABH919_00485, partial [bacterium]